MEGGLKTNEPEVANILRKLDAETGGEADEGAMLCNQQRAIVRKAGLVAVDGIGWTGDERG